MIFILFYYYFIIKLYVKLLNYYFFYLDIQLCNLINYSDLYPLLPSLFDLFDRMPNSGIWNVAMRNCWGECLDRLKKNNKLPKEYQEEDKSKEIFNGLPE